MNCWYKSALFLIGVSVLFLGLLCSPASAALQYFSVDNATLVVDDETGMLMGADNVLVTDSNDELLGYYDVRFAEGSANSLFGTGSSGPYNFGDLSSGPLPANQMSYWMSQALMDRVFVNLDDDHKFDSRPYLTYGIGVDVASPENDEDFRWFSGSIYTAYSYDDINNDIYATYLYNYCSTGGDYLKTNTTLTPTSNSSDSSPWVYAVWTESAAVPVPASLLIFGSGLLGLAGIRRHHNK